MIGRHDGFVDIMPVHPYSAKPWQGSWVYIYGSGRFESSYKLQPPGAHHKVSLIFFNECPVSFGIIGSWPILKRNMKCIRFSANSSIFTVRNDSDDLGVEDRRIRSGKFDQFLEPGASPPGIATRKN
jgi:hypothetical protein